MAEKHIGQTNGAFTVHYPLRQADALSGNVLSGNAEEGSAAVSPYEREQRGNRSAGAACVLTQTGRTPAAGIRQNSGTLPEERRSFV